jgi:ubiquinone/menaquinone biosynthesis C-methylase UbiE
VARGRRSARSEDAEIQWRYRRRIALFGSVAVVAVTAMGATAWTVTAVERVDAVEAERDSWQRPADVVQALDLSEGSVVVDLGSGVGYFALKLTDGVGRRGRVLAVDVRRFPLLFLRVRALLRGRRNLQCVHGEPGDPHLPAAGVDAVLVANTFHELEDRELILGRARDALRPAGRLVVVDPSPHEAAPARAGSETHHHESPDSAEAWLRQAGFEIVSRDDSSSTARATAAGG